MFSPLFGTANTENFYFIAAYPGWESSGQHVGRDESTV